LRTPTAPFSPVLALDGYHLALLRLWVMHVGADLVRGGRLARSGSVLDDLGSGVEPCQGDVAERHPLEHLDLDRRVVVHEDPPDIALRDRCP
jgi:hypothetical protein